MDTQEFVDKLLNLNRATFLTFTATTDTKAKAKDNPFPRPIMKRSRVNGMVNFHYDDGVIRRLKNEGKSPDDFKQGTSWHEPIFRDGRLTPLCASKSHENHKVYLRFMLLKRLDAQYIDASNVTRTEEEVKPFLPTKSGYQNQGLDEPLVFLTYDLRNVQDVTLDGHTYEIDHHQPFSLLTAAQKLVS